MAGRLTIIVLPKNRNDLETTIETLIAHLDDLDGEADLEDSDPAEYSLGWAEAESQAGRLGFGADWKEPNGDEQDTSFCFDEWYVYRKADYFKAIATRQATVAALKNVSRLTA